MALTKLINSNLHALDDLLALLLSLSQERYVDVQRPYFESSLGKHTRHVLDHYDCFRRDLPTGLINYDQRPRDERIENDKVYALSFLQELREFMQSLTTLIEVNQTLQVLMCNDVEMPDGVVTDSSVGRELQFLQGHSVHHYALMAAMLRISGDSVKTSLGIAPSTLLYNRVDKAS